MSNNRIQKYLIFQVIFLCSIGVFGQLVIKETIIGIWTTGHLNKDNIVVKINSKGSNGSLLIKNDMSIYFGVNNCGYEIARKGDWSLDTLKNNINFYFTEFIGYRDVIDLSINERMEKLEILRLNKSGLILYNHKTNYTRYFWRR